MFRRLGYRIGSMLGSQTAGHRFQLEEWRQSALDHRAGYRDVSLTELANQQQTEWDWAAEHNERIWTRWGSGLPRCGNPDCRDPRCD